MYETIGNTKAFITYELWLFDFKSWVYFVTFIGTCLGGLPYNRLRRQIVGILLQATAAKLFRRIHFDNDK